jgi:hypothetical protein
MCRVRIVSQGIDGEVEWEIELESLTLRGAQIRAGLWLKKRLFGSDVGTIDKYQVSSNREVWVLKRKESSNAGSVGKND